MIRFFVRCRAGENGTWQDSLYNEELGCKTEREAGVLLGKLENIPANEDLEYSVVEREVVAEVKWFIQVEDYELRGVWKNSKYNPFGGWKCESEAEALMLSKARYTLTNYRLISEQVPYAI